MLHSNRLSSSVFLSINSNAVLTDGALADLRLNDANLVVHYAPPESLQQFEKRLWCMRKNFQYMAEGDQVSGYQLCPWNDQSPRLPAAWFNIKVFLTAN